MRPAHPRIVRPLLAAMFAAVVLAAGCGVDSDPEVVASTEPSEPTESTEPSTSTTTTEATTTTT